MTIDEKVFVIESEESQLYEQYWKVVEVLRPDFLVPAERASGATEIYARVVRNITIEYAVSKETQKCWLNFKGRIQELNNAKSAVLDQRRMTIDALRSLCITKEDYVAQVDHEPDDPKQESILIVQDLTKHFEEPGTRNAPYALPRLRRLLALLQEAS